MTRSLPPAAALLLLAACSDSPSAPAAPARPAEPPDGRVAADLVVNGPIPPLAQVTVKLHVLHQSGGDQAGTTMEFRTDAGFVKSVADGGAGDADARPGYYSVQMPKANAYTATAKPLPDFISPWQSSKTVSYFNSPTLVDMGSLVLSIKPGFFITMYYQGAVVTGQTLKITNGSDFSVTITDGGANDKDGYGDPSPADGKIFVRVPYTGSYQLCAVTAPAWGWGGCVQAVAPQYFAAYDVSYSYKQQWVLPKLP